MPARHSEDERQRILAGLTDQQRAVYGRLSRSERWMSAGQIAEALAARADQIEPILRALETLGLIEHADPSEKRPFGALYRPAPFRLPVVGDWLAGGLADRGYADLSAIQRDYHSVKALSDPADGAEADRAAAETEKALATAREDEDAALTAQAQQDAQAKAERQAKRRAALAAQDAATGEGGA